MSEYVVHFTKGNDDNAYGTMMAILSSRTLRGAAKFGIARSLDAPEPTQSSVCFSEIPLDRLDRLVERRGTKYGIGFRQDVLVAAGGARVWYVDKDSQAAESVRRLVEQAMGPPFDRTHPVWEIARFIDFPGDYGETQYRFEWEREWRVPGELTFETGEGAFLFVPEDLHDDARSFFADAAATNTGPAYTCPFLDPLWSDEQIQAALGGL